MTLYIENPKDSTKKTTKTDELNHVAGYQINIQTSLGFLYINNKLAERETKKTIPFTIASKK